MNFKEYDYSRTSHCAHGAQASGGPRTPLEYGMEKMGKKKGERKKKRKERKRKKRKRKEREKTYFCLLLNLHFAKLTLLHENGSLTVAELA